MSQYNDTDSWGIDFETFKLIQAKHGQLTNIAEWNKIVIKKK